MLPLLSTKLTAETKNKAAFSRDGGTPQRLHFSLISQSDPNSPFPDILTLLFIYLHTAEEREHRVLQQLLGRHHCCYFFINTLLFPVKIFLEVFCISQLFCFLHFSHFQSSRRISMYLLYLCSLIPSTF